MYNMRQYRVICFGYQAEHEFIKKEFTITLEAIDKYDAENKAKKMYKCEVRAVIDTRRY